MVCHGNVSNDIIQGVLEGREGRSECSNHSWKREALRPRIYGGEREEEEEEEGEREGGEEEEEGGREEREEEGKEVGEGGDGKELQLGALSSATNILDVFDII